MTRRRGGGPHRERAVGTRGARGGARRAVARCIQAAFYHLIAMPLLFVACLIWFGVPELRRRGRQTELPCGGCVLVANHVHYLDAVLVALSVWPRRLHVLVDRANWDHPFIGLFMRAFACIPTGENLGEARAMLASMREVVGRGGVLLVFPEGELSCYRQGFAPFHPGAFALAARTGAPVVPVVLAQRLRGVSLCRALGRPRLVVRRGAPVEVAHGQGAGRAGVVGLERVVRARMEELLG